MPIPLQRRESCAGARLGGRSLADGVETSCLESVMFCLTTRGRTTCQLRFQLSPGRCERVGVRGLSHEGEGGGVVVGLLRYKR